MADQADERPPPWQSPSTLVDAWIHSVSGDARELNAAQLATYGRRAFVRGWRVPVRMADATRSFDLLLDGQFPWSTPRVALVSPPPYGTWPHVEGDAFLCTTALGSEVSLDDPVAAAKRVLSDAVDIVAAGVSGTNEDDFRDEFLSYWNWDAVGPRFRSLVEPGGPSRLIHVWRGKHFLVLGETAEEVRQWVLRQWPDTSTTIAEALLISTGRPLVPAEYPRVAQDVRLLARNAGCENLLVDLTKSNPDALAVMLEVAPEVGPSFGGVVLTPPSGVVKGFRPGHVPQALLSTRYLSGRAASRRQVERLDPAWVHSRAADPAFESLRDAHVLFVGCGSLGSSAALALAEAGVGSLTLIDPELMGSANVGRHALGTSEIGQFKASGVASRLGRSYPHMRAITAITKRWEEALAVAPDLFDGVDLIISTLGTWSSEGPLNAWHHETRRKQPVLYGWTEPFAVAGHAVTITAATGCLACGLTDSGAMRNAVVKWPTSTLLSEPACGVTYQPYGPTELQHTIALITETAIDELSTDGALPHRVWAGRRSLVQRTGGQWTDEWAAEYSQRLEGAFQADRTWDRRAECPLCHGRAP